MNQPNTMHVLWILTQTNQLLRSIFEKGNNMDWVFDNKNIIVNCVSSNNGIAFMFEKTYIFRNIY